MSAVALTAARREPRALAAGLWVFATVAIALGAARAVTTTYVPVLLERIADKPGLIGAVMLVNAAAGFAVPLATGLWSDRRGTRGPFILGGSIVAAGGLVAIALGTASSYLVLALAAATVYVGLNAASTAHRALVTERFSEDRRAAATSAQEGAMLVGALAGTVIGGALIDSSAAALFVVWALLLPLLALPTLAWQRTSAPARAAAPAAPQGSAVKLLLEVLHRDGARQVLDRADPLGRLLHRADAVHGPLRRGGARPPRRGRRAAARGLRDRHGRGHGLGRPAARRPPAPDAARRRRAARRRPVDRDGGLERRPGGAPVRGGRARRRPRERRRLPLLLPLRPRRGGGPLRRRLLLRARHRDDRGAARGRAADRDHRLLPRAAGDGRRRARRPGAAGPRRAPPRARGAHGARAAARSSGSPR